jgi:CO/xanthine dehydrogenase FAD-binding subunit
MQGWIYFLKNDYQKTIALDRKADSIFRKVLGPGGDFSVGTLITLSTALSRVGELNEAESVARQALAESASKPRRAQAKGALGEALMLAKKFTDAEPLLLESFAELKTVHGPKHYRTKIARDRLIALYEALGTPEKAQAYRE